MTIMPLLWSDPISQLNIIQNTEIPPFLTYVIFSYGQTSDTDNDSSLLTYVGWLHIASTSDKIMNPPFCVIPCHGGCSCISI